MKVPWQASNKKHINTQEMSERLEDIKDLRMLEKIREKPLKFKKLDDFLKEYHQSALIHEKT